VAAALILAAILFGVATPGNIVPSFDLQFPLLHGTTLEIGVVAGCPPMMPAMVCLHIEDQFPQAFKVVYWSAGEASTLVSITLPQTLPR